MKPEIAAGVIRSHGHRAVVECDGRVHAWCLAVTRNGAVYEHLDTFRPNAHGEISTRAIRDWLGY
jgi:hypothetical protein